MEKCLFIYGKRQDRYELQCIVTPKDFAVKTTLDKYFYALKNDLYEGLFLIEVNLTPVELYLIEERWGLTGTSGNFVELLGDHVLAVDKERGAKTGTNLPATDDLERRILKHDRIEGKTTAARRALTFEAYYEKWADWLNI